MKRAVIIFAVVFSSLLFATPPLAGAASSLDAVCTGKGAQSAVCKDKNPGSNPLTGSDGLLLKIANIIATVAGIAAIIVIVLAGLRFVTSGGGSEDVAGARRTILYASIGLVVIVLGRALVGLVLSKL